MDSAWVQIFIYVLAVVNFTKYYTYNKNTGTQFRIVAKLLSKLVWLWRPLTGISLENG